MISLLLLTSYNAGTYLRPWSDTRTMAAEDDERSHIRYIAHGYPPATLTSLQDVLAGFTVPNYLTGLAAALLSTTLEAGCAQRVLAILAPYQIAQPHCGMYHGPGLSQADVHWIKTQPQRSLAPAFGPEHHTAIETALQLTAAPAEVLEQLAGLARWSQERWTQVRNQVGSTLSSSTATLTSASSRGVGAAPVEVSSQHALGDGNLYL